MELVLIKLGGSLITDKDQPYTARPKVMAQLAQELKQIKSANPHLHLIIGNGAGSFGHQSAKKYNTINGFSSDTEKLGFCLVHQDSINLNFLLARYFLEACLPIVSLPPLMMVSTENKKLSTINFTAIENSLKADLIPLVFGDVVIDKTIGGTILSTDTLLVELARYFHCQNNNYKIRIINAGNYPGVLGEKGEILPHISAANYQEIKKYLGVSTSVDVTGGMAQKVEEFLAISSLGIECWIIDGNIPGNLANTILGRSNSGTVIC